MIDWSKVNVYFVDERIVDYNSKDNNAWQCYELWLKYCRGIKFFRINTKLVAEKAAAAYSDTVSNNLSKREDVFDLVLLGVGADGHIASIFPGSPLINDFSRLYSHTEHPHNGYCRVSMTLPFIMNARNIIVGIFGESKKWLLDSIKTVNAGKYPFSKLYEKSNSNIRWVVC